MSGRLLLLALALIVAGCRKPPQAEAQHPQEANSAQPELLSVPPDQVAHLKTVEVATANWSITIQTTGTVDWDADHTTQAITQVNGPITRIMADLGTPVQKDQALLYVSSPDVANGISTYRKARNREVYNKRIVDRMKELFDRGAIAAKDFQSSEADYNDAMTDVQTSLQALRIFGITSQDIEAAEKQGSPVSTELAVRSPISGVVIQKLVSPGMVIQAGQTVCFAISDVSTVWVQGHIFDRDLPAVKKGDPVDETNPSFPHAFKGAISYIGSSVDPNTRTTPVRIVTQNPGGLLKKDMFVDAVVHTGMRRNMLVVPISAVLRDDKNEPMVYVETTPGKFAQRSVTMAGQQDGMAAIANGLQTGEKVVTDGGLFLQFANTIR
ncbi:MAG: efflux RND transporter periplasmic adaptor subunit [Bryobacteraceae bacterium]